MNFQLDTYDRFVYEFNIYQFYLSRQVSNLVANYVICLVILFFLICFIFSLFVLLFIWFYKFLRGDIIC